MSNSAKCEQIANVNHRDHATPIKANSRSIVRLGYAPRFDRLSLCISTFRLQRQRTAVAQTRAFFASAALKRHLRTAAALGAPASARCVRARITRCVARSSPPQPASQPLVVAIVVKVGRCTRARARSRLHTVFEVVESEDNWIRGLREMRER